MSLSRLPHVEPGSPAVRTPAGFLFWVARRQWGTLLLGIVWATVWLVAQAGVPAALGLAVGGAARGDGALVTAAAAAVLGLGLVQTTAGILRHRMAVTNWISAASRTQQLVVRQAVSLGPSLSREVATGEVVAVTSTDVEKIGSAFDVVARFVGAVVAFVAVAVVLLRTSVLLGVVALVGAPLLAAAIAPLLGPLERRESLQRERLGRASALASDTVAGLRVLRGIGGEDEFVARYRRSSQHVRGAAVRVAQIRSLLDALQVALPGALLVAVTWIGARQVVAGELSVGQLVAFYGYTAFLVIPLQTFTEGARKWTSAYVAARRVISVLALPAPHEPAQVESEPDLRRADLVDPRTGLRVRPGRFVGVVCADPEAADALALRLGGFGPGGGAVTVAGHRLDRLDRTFVRAGVLVQDKDPVLLSGTLGELFDVPRSGRVDTVAALRAAWAGDAVDAVEAGDEAAAGARTARITERGRSLSGGQRQRLALARSLVVDPPVLVLDEPTSAVDAHTEARIAVALTELRGNRTTVVMTTSPLLLDRCDEVVLLTADGVSAVGTHHALLRTEPLYRAIVGREDDA